MMLANAYLAQRDGKGGLATAALERVQPMLADGPATLQGMFRIVQAGAMADEGKLSEAIELLRPRANDLYQSRVALCRLLVAAQRYAEAEEQARWLLANRGLAFVEANASQALQPMNVGDSRQARLWLAEILAAHGREEMAAAEVRAFLQQWSGDSLPRQLRSKAESILSASKQNTTV